jgi:hypothetical protein
MIARTMIDDVIRMRARTQFRSLNRCKDHPPDRPALSKGAFIASRLEKVVPNVRVDFPMSIDNTALHVVPDYPLRASLAARF